MGDHFLSPLEAKIEHNGIMNPLPSTQGNLFIAIVPATGT